MAREFPPDIMPSLLPNRKKLASHIRVLRGTRGAEASQRARPAPPATCVAPSSAPPRPRLGGRIRAATTEEAETQQNRVSPKDSRSSGLHLSPRGQLGV